MKDNAEKIVRKADKFYFAGKVKRHKFLDSIYKEYEGFIASGGIAHEYLYEATRCWLDGQFIATIVMMQMAFEEGLRNAFRTPYVFRDDDKMIRKIDGMSFHDIIEFAKTNKYLTEYESVRFHTLRKMRNPFVHVKRNNRRKRGYFRIVYHAKNF